MTRMMKAAVTLAILTSLTACDYAAKHELRRERADGVYQAAMADYKAGRVDQAIAGFEKVIHADPANASARFQVACLQQDLRKDFISAFCNYREYLLQHPASDKTGLAKERLAVCERELARALAEKHGLNQAAALAKEAEVAHNELKTSEQTRAKLEKDLAAATQKIAAMEADRKRLVSIMKTDVDNEDDKPVASTTRDVKALLEEDDGQSGDRIKMSRDVAALRLEEKDETETSSSLLPEQPESAKERRDAARAAQVARKEKSKADILHEKKPETYVIQQGDTLSLIALRFYGRKQAWVKIRDANKAVISTDGRVRVGDTIRLP